MRKILPIAIINGQSTSLLYFDCAAIETPEKIERAYIMADRRTKHEPKICLNRDLPKKYRETFVNGLSELPGDCRNECILGDATEIVKMMSEKYVPNNGITINNPYICRANLHIIYRRDVIYPDTRPFFEKELVLSGYKGLLKSPWVYCALALSYSFFIENTGANPIGLHIEYSPNTLNVTRSKSVTLVPNDTACISPTSFSKFARLHAESNGEKISLKVWFQARL